MQIQASAVKIIRDELSLTPDHKKVITRFFYPGEKREKNIVKRITRLSDEEVAFILAQTL